MTNDAPAPAQTLAGNWLALLVLFGAHVVGSMAFIAIATMAPLIRADLALSATGFGFLIWAYFFAQGILALPIGALIDQFGLRASLFTASATLALGSALLSIADDRSFALAAMAVLGIGYCFVNPSTSKGVFLLFPAARRGTAMGIKQSGVPIGGILGAALGGLAHIYSWCGLLLVVAAMAVAFAFAGLLLPIRNSGARASGAGPRLRALAKSVASVVADRNLTAFNLGAGLYQAAQFSFFGYLTLFLREVLVFSQPAAAACLGIAQAASAAGRMSWGAVSDFAFRGRRQPVLVIMTVTAITGLLAMAAMAMIGPQPWTQVAAIALAAVLGLSVAGYVALIQTVVVEMADPEFTATSVAYNRLFVSLGASVGPPLFGLAVDQSGGYVAGWLTTAAFVVCVLVLFGVVFRERRT